MPYGTTLRMDDDLDLSIVDERIEMISAPDKIAQDLKILLTTALGDSIMHPSFGLDQLAMFADAVIDRVFEDRIRKALDQYPHLRAVNSIAIDRDISLRLVTIDIDLAIEEDFNIVVQVTLG